MIIPMDSSEKGNGEELLELGYQFQRTGVKAPLPSLWEVDDCGTQALK
jgi:CHAT domain-containing protein